MVERISVQLSRQSVDLQASSLEFAHQSRRALRAREECVRKMGDAQRKGQMMLAEQFAREAVALEKTAADMEIMAARVRSASVRLDSLLQSRLAAHSMAKIVQTVQSIHGLTDTAAVDQALKQFDAVVDSLQRSSDAVAGGLAPKNSPEDEAVRRLLEQGQSAADLTLRLPSVPDASVVPDESTTTDADLEKRFQKLRSI